MKLNGFLFLLFILSEWNSAIAQNWVQLGAGLDFPGQVLYTDTVTNKLFVGGNLRHAGGKLATSIAAWDGSNWDTLAGGVTDQNPVKCITRYQNQIYAGGLFRKAGGKFVNGFTRWNGSGWDSINSACHSIGSIVGFSVYNNLLYCQGSFDSVANILSPLSAIWNGSVWTPMGIPHSAGGAIGKCIEFQGQLYFSGTFTDSTNTLFDFVKWDGINWYKVGTNFSGYLYCMAIYNNELYIGGNLLNGVPGVHIVKYDGANFYSVGGDVDGPVLSMKVIGGKLFAVGGFSFAGGVPASRIAKWDGNLWSPLSNDTLDNTITDLELFNNELYITGGFSYPIGFIGKYTGPLSTTNLHNHSFNFCLTPNPSNSFLTVSFSSPLLEDVILSTSDPAGKQQFRLFIPSQTIRKELDISELAAGVYFITLESESGRVTKKFIKE